MKHFIILLICLTFCQQLHSANARELRIVDGKTKEVLISATVKITCISKSCRDSTVVMKTDKYGKVYYKFNSDIAVAVSYIGYKPFKDTIRGNDKLVFINMESTSVVLDAIVTTGQLMPTTSQKSIYPVKVVSEERIEAQAATNLRDLLVNESNIRVNQDGVLGSSITINGISGQNVKILVDGMPIIGRMDGNIDISQINLNNKDQVEIVEGPMSSIYGTDALGGVINLRTRIPKDGKTHINSNSNIESVGQYNFDGSIDYPLNETNMLSLSGGRNFFAGYSLVDTSRHKDWKPKEQYFSDLQYISDINNFRLKVTGSYFYEFVLNRGIPRSPLYVTAFDDNYETRRYSGGAFLNGKIADHQFIDFNAGYSHYIHKKNTFFKDLVTLGEVMTTSLEDQDTTVFDNVTIRGTYSHDNLMDNLGIQLGFDINWDRGTGRLILDEEQTEADYAAFCFAQYYIFKELVIQPALRVIYNTKYDAPLVPAFNIKAEPIDHFIIRASYAKGFRAPALKELFLDFVDINHDIHGNPDLKAEYSDSYNISFNYNIEETQHVIKFDQKFFFNSILNQITLGYNADQNKYYYTNIGKFQTLGGDFTIQYFRPFISSKLTISYTGVSNQLDDYNPPNKFDYTPEVQLTTILNLPYIDTQFGLFYKYTGKQPRTGVTIDDNSGDTTFYQYSVDPYSMMDISFSRDFFDKYLNLTIGIRNLFDINDIMTNGAPVSTGAHSGDSGSGIPVGYGRTYFANIKIRV